MDQNLPEISLPRQGSRDSCPDAPALPEGTRHHTNPEGEPNNILSNSKGKSEGRDEIGHLEVVRLLDVGGGGVHADPQDVVVGAVLDHGRHLPGSLACRRQRGLRAALAPTTKRMLSATEAEAGRIRC
jgi:hypothetical protein